MVGYSTINKMCNLTTKKKCTALCIPKCAFELAYTWQNTLPFLLTVSIRAVHKSSPDDNDDDDNDDDEAAFRCALLTYQETSMQHVWIVFRLWGPCVLPFACIPCRCNIMKLDGRK